MTAWLLTLAVFAGLSTNLVLQFGMGVRELALSGRAGSPSPGRGGALGLPARAGVFFVSVPLLWLAFSAARSLLPLGFLEYLLVFPVGFAVFSLWEHLWARYPSGRRDAKKRRDGNAGNSGAADVFGGASVGAALFVALTVAGDVAEALVLSLGFTLGTLFAVAAVGEIRRRSETESVPRWLRGAPLTLIAMGLLALVFSSSAMMFFEVLGNG